MKNYTFNLETKKIELRFEKSEYQALTDSQKAQLKSNFLWSNRAGGWVSRAKEPNLWKAKQVAAALGFTEEVRTGERLSFAEQVERQQERAEYRAERYEQRAANAEKKGEQLCAGLDSMHGDIAFFTQPIQPTAAGRAFQRRREKLYARYDSGMDEYRKSEYFTKQAERLHESANGAKYRDVAFLDRRIKETKSEIRARFRNVEEYEKRLERIEKGETLKSYSGEVITAETIESWLERELELIEVAEDKLAYLQNAFDECGGGKFSQANVKIGYRVKLNRWRGEIVEVVGTGKVNFTYKDTQGWAKQAAYAEIAEIVSAEEAPKEAHPYKVGETYTARKWNGQRWENVDFTIISTTETSVKIQPSDGTKAFLRRPTKSKFRNGWNLTLTDAYDGYVCKENA
ncbi:MAG: DUF3560 domain-containing protein [Clostridia bacterium]|nr:DUF3560 domain-containing protein [Clostridia bacterium]